MKLIIKGKGGQGVFFLSKVLAHAWMMKGIYNFTFLKEFDEGQRNGEIKVTFNFNTTLLWSTRPAPKNKSEEWIVKENNMKELKKICKSAGIEDKLIRKALMKLKPERFTKNWKLYNGKN